MMRFRDSERRSLLVVASVLHWDLFLAAVVASVVTLALSIRDLDPQWVWLTPVAGLTMVILGIAWRQRATLRNSLGDSYYGELVRMVDKDESEIRLPYTLTILIAAIATALAASSAVIVEVVGSEIVSYVMLGISSFFASWSFFGLLMLIRLSDVHEREIAGLQADAEEMRSLQALSKKSTRPKSQPEEHD